MDKQRSSLTVETQNQPSYQRHKKQRFWQILAPIGAGVLLVAAVMVLIILTATGGDPGAQVSGWADTSLIWLILPVLLVAVGVALLLFALVYLLARFLKILPSYISLVQNYATLAAVQVKYWSDKVVAPLITVKSSWAGISGLFGGPRGRSRK